MAVTHKKSEQYTKELHLGEHDIETHDLVVILLDNTFPGFNPATHSIYTDISGYELATGGGYTQLDKSITTVSVDIVDNKVLVTGDNVSWTATTGGIPETIAAAIINNTHANKTVISCIEFGAGYTTADGTVFQINFANGIFRGTPNPV